VPNLRYEADTSASPERVLAAVRDFSERRTELWGNVAPEYYEVHEVGDAFAEVTEGTRFLGGVWERERYEWPQANAVRATVKESNFKARGVWEITVTPRDGGSHVEVLNDWQPKGFKGRLVDAILRVTGRWVLGAELKRTLSRIEDEAGGGSPPSSASPV
jgi:hypothetical protein